VNALAETMRRNGILRAAEVVEVAAQAGLDLASACVLLVKESGGGRNIYGHDAVDTGGAYVKGGPVTRENYTAYLAAVRAGRAGRQGVGPTQLTAADYQDAADRAGGCWDWRTNCLVGFRLLAAHQRRYGERGGWVAYNGGPGALTRSASHPAQLYADDAMRKVAQWRTLLPAPPEDDDVTPEDIEAIARRAADLVWQRPTVNAWGDIVGAEQILAGAEGRVADVQDVTHRLAAGGVDLDALAARVVALLAARLGGG
jgi:hypothetical protein